MHVHILGMLPCRLYAIMRLHMRSHILPKPAIMYFSTYNGIFKIAYAKVMPHIQKFAYIHSFAHMPHISGYVIAFFLSNVVFRPLNIFGDKRLPVFTIRR